MSALDCGPVGDFEVVYANDVAAPYDVAVLLLDVDGDETIANLTPARARKLAYALLHQVEEGAEEKRSKLMQDELIAAGILPPREPEPTLRAVEAVA